MSGARLPRVVVTRPAAQAVSWVQRLVALGIDAVAVPLIEIGAAPDAEAVRAAWAGLTSRRLVVFISVNAVLRFFAARPADAEWPMSLVAAAPGPGTAEALRSEGVAAASIVEPADDAPQLDSEALWQRLSAHDWHGARVLVVRGDGGRDWLVERLVEAGAEVDAVAAYSRGVPQLSAEAQRHMDAACADPSAHLWLFSSSEAVANLALLAGATPTGDSRAIATHPRIAARARQAGFANVSEVSPGLDAVAACIQSMRP